MTASLPLAHASISFALLGSLVLFAFVTSITPGPNNIMLAASGLSFGFKRTIPHMLGISAGFMLMVLLIGLGLGTAFQTWPWLHIIIKYAGAAYLLYLAWLIARAGPVGQGASQGRPFTFWQAAAFQWVNPKAWVMAIGVIATYTPQAGFFVNLLIATLLCGLVNLPSVCVWALFGSSLRHLLRKPGAIRLFNIGMALLLVASLYPVAWELATHSAFVAPLSQGVQ